MTKLWSSDEVSLFWDNGEWEFPQYCSCMQVVHLDLENAPQIHLRVHLPYGIEYSKIKKGDVIEAMYRERGQIPDLYRDEKIFMRCEILSILSKAMESFPASYYTDTERLSILIKAVGKIDLKEIQDE